MTSGRAALLLCSQEEALGVSHDRLKTAETLSAECPQTRQTEALRLAMRAEVAETVTVPAGTFDTFKIVRRNTRSGVVDGEFGYAPQARNVFNDQLRELTKFVGQP